ncbi:SLC13 family permease [Natronolimnohabitans innermongolicus]|uniref:Citrate transporter n=1 Tax=Natronolimnohabitans innermongolicus JCM 12255 TaxID=1227499 RepID=L9WNC5_9EURY|nr:SLC13 family permease [Natronolimnohabitans innermongolicus]ELY50959.1 Citrate transporter [Natronolimnohabitans innermongolicus JCM 12255]
MNHRSVIESVRAPPVAFALAIAVAATTWFALSGTGDAAWMLSITIFCIALWILTPVPPAYTGLIGIGLIAVTFSTELALTGFQKPATWLIGFGLLMGEATRRSGLANWAGSKITARTVSESASVQPVRTYRRLLVALSIGAHALALLIPSALVRILIIAPILKETGDLFDDRAARVGLFLGPAFATFYGSSGILTADLPNIMITGFGGSIAGHHVSWTEWLFHMYPIMGLTRVLMVCAIVYFLFRPDPSSSVDLPTQTGGPTRTERRMLAFLLVGAAIWATDFVHGFHPVVGAVAVVVLAFLPNIGVTDFESVGETDFSIIFFIAAVFAIGDGLAHTGFTEDAAEHLLALVPTDASLMVVLAVVFAITFLLAFLMEGLAVASVLTPILIPYAEAAGLPLTPVLMSEAMALSAYFFPYQSAVLIVILAEGTADTGEVIRTTVACSVATICLLIPLQLAFFTFLY